MGDKLILAGCVILDEEGKVLLIHRNTTKRTQWETPGGKVEDDEDPEETAKREIKEEIGVEVKIIKKLGQKDFTENDFTMEYTWFLAEIISGIPDYMEKETYDNLKYFSWEELKDREDLSANTKNLVNAYFNREIVF